MIEKKRRGVSEPLEDLRENVDGSAPPKPQSALTHFEKTTFPNSKERMGESAGKYLNRRMTNSISGLRRKLVKVFRISSTGPFAAIGKSRDKARLGGGNPSHTQ